MQRDSPTRRTIGRGERPTPQGGLSLPPVRPRASSRKRRTHRGQAAAMPGPEVPVWQTGQSAASPRGVADSGEQGEGPKAPSLARQNLTPREGDAERRGGLGPACRAWQGLTPREAGESRGGRGRGVPRAGLGDHTTRRSADCAVGSGQWAEPPHPPWALHRRGSPEGTFWPPAGGPPPEAPEDQSPRGSGGAHAHCRSSARDQGRRRSPLVAPS